MTAILSWFLMGILGWLLIVQAYIRLEGNNPKRALHQLPVILVGPIAIVMAFFFHWDLLFDPPRRYTPDPNLLKDAIADAKALRLTALANAKRNSNLH